MSTTTGSSVVTYERDATDRIMSRTAGGVTLRYSYSGSGDSPDMVMTTTNSVVDKMVDLLGGVTKTTHLEANVYSDRYNYPNIHGDVMALADGSGNKVGPTKTYDPFGNPLTALVDNLTGNFDEGWLGSKDRLTETEGGINIIEMGQRQYSPKLGRFLEVDPVEGGSANDYDYCDGDPISNFDLAGTYCLTGKNKNGSCRNIARGAWGHRAGIMAIAGTAACGAAIIGTAGVAAAACVPLALAGAGNTIVTSGYENKVWDRKRANYGKFALQSGAAVASVALPAKGSQWLASQKGASRSYLKFQNPKGVMYLTGEAMNYSTGPIADVKW